VLQHWNTWGVDEGEEKKKGNYKKKEITKCLGLHSPGKVEQHGAPVAEQDLFVSILTSMRP